MNTYSTRSQLLESAAWRPLVERIESAPRKDGTVSHYFDRATIAGWGNQWHGAPVQRPYSDGTLYYVESSDDMTSDGTRVYQVKSVSPDGTVYTISDWPHYPTAADAVAARNFVAGVA